MMQCREWNIIIFAGINTVCRVARENGARANGSEYINRNNNTHRGPTTSDIEVAYSEGHLESGGHV